MISRRSLLVVLVAAGLAAARGPASAQEAWTPAGGWARWLGLEPGGTLVYQRSDGARTCAIVGEPIRRNGARWLPLDNVPWPGIASDSRILLPLEGPPRLGTILTPGPRPHVDLLVPVADSLRWGLPPQAKPGGVLDPAYPLPPSMEDGWYIVGNLDDPDLLVFIRCAACVDAGLRLVLERGKGIRSMSSTTIVGTESFQRVEGACADREGEQTEFEVYMIPDRDRQP